MNPSPITHNLSEGVSDAEIMQSCSYLPEVKPGDRVKVNQGGNKSRVGQAHDVGKDTVTVEWLDTAGPREEICSNKVEHIDAIRCTSYQVQVRLKILILNLTLFLHSNTCLTLHFLRDAGG